MICLLIAFELTPGRINKVHLYTSPKYTSLHFTTLHPTTLHYPPICRNPI